jgi:hypothetical protein
VILNLYSRNPELFNNVFSTDSVKQAMAKQNLYRPGQALKVPGG